MAKRRRSGKKSRGGFFRSSRRSGGRRGGGGDRFWGQVLGGFAYGGLRERLSNALAPVTSSVAGPLGNLADEAVIGVVAWQVAKRSKPGMIKDFAKAALTIESARAGEVVLGGLAPSAGSTGPFLMATVR